MIFRIMFLQPVGSVKGRRFFLRRDPSFNRTVVPLQDQIRGSIHTSSLQHHLFLLQVINLTIPNLKCCAYFLPLATVTLFVTRVTRSCHRENHVDVSLTAASYIAHNVKNGLEGGWT